MIVSLLRCIIIYFIVLIVIRVMGKRQIAQMQPFDVVITLIIADLATIPMSDQSVPLLNGIIPLLVLTVLHFITTFLSCKSLKLRHFFNGKPVILVSPKGVLEDNIKRLNMTLADVMEASRYAGYFSLNDVLYMIMETNGNISIIPKSDSTPIIRADMKIKKEEAKLPVVLISDGKLSFENLQITKVQESSLKQFLKKYDAVVKDVVVMHYASNGEIFLQIRNRGVFTDNVNLTKGE